jgi:transposase
MFRWPRPSKYPEEFRRDAVELVLASPQRTVAEIAKELGLNRETLRQWVKAERDARVAGAGRGRSAEGDGGQLSTDEREELRRLRKQVAELQLEKEILRKAAAYFAKEMGR